MIDNPPLWGGCWVVPSSSWVLFSLRWGPWRLSSSMSSALEGWLIVGPSSSLWGVGAVPRYVLVFIFIVVYFVGGLNELIWQYTFIQIVVFSPNLQKSSDILLPSLTHLLPRTKCLTSRLEKRVDVWGGRGSFRADTCHSVSSRLDAKK